MQDVHEQKEREWRRKEADEVMKNLELPASIRELKPRLIGRFRPAISAVWPSRQGGLREVSDLFMRTHDGRYFVFHDAGDDGYFTDVSTKKAHELLRGTDWEWFATESERLEFEIFDDS